MAEPKLTYIALRAQPDGSVRPRFQPGPRERAIGFKNMDLQHADGRWFTTDEARAWSIAKREEIRAARKSGKRVRTPPAKRGKTVEDLLNAFFNSPKFKLERAHGGYAEKTKADYREKAAMMIYKPETHAQRRAREAAGKEREKELFALMPARAVLPRTIFDNSEGNQVGGFYPYLCKARGQRSARNCIMVLSAAYKWSRKAKGWDDPPMSNPCTELGIVKPDVGEAETYTLDEFKAVIAMAEHPDVAEHELADAFFLGLFSGQRPADVSAYDATGTSEGKTRLVQSKTGKRVEIPALPPLTARLELMAEHRAARGYLCKELIVDSHTGRGFNQNTFEHRVRALLNMTIAGRADLGLSPCPSLAGKSFKHLRKTLLTWVKRAGATDQQFAAVSGHSLASLPQVMPHYYTPGSVEAGEAMTLVWSWMQQKGMKL
jgi:hypothetical protein